MVLMSWGQQDPLTLKIHAQYPDRIIPFVSQDYNPHDLTQLSSFENKLNNRIFKGVGELLLRHTATSTGDPEIIVPADCDFIKKLSDIAKEHDAVMNIHLEWNSEAVASLDNLLSYNEEVKVIWSHLGTVRRPGSATANVAHFMDKHENLYTDFSGMQPTELAPSAGGRLPTITTGRFLLPQFKELFEKYSDRVLFGLDTPKMECWAEDPFVKWTQWTDSVVAQLDDPKMGENIMWRNAVELLKL
jgi:predicted TIM-barrel fold metal-dependent hydrolase